MSDAKFEIRSDPARSFLHIMWHGHWEVTTVTAYKDHLLRTITQMREQGVAPGEIVALVDARGIGPQSRDVTEAYQKSFSDPDLRPRRLATLLSSALFKLQVQRLAVVDQRIFDNEEEALTWLFS